MARAGRWSPTARAVPAAAATATSTLLTGLTNVALPALVQATGSLDDLGAFAIAFLPLGIALAMSRGLTTQTVLRGWRFQQCPGLCTLLTAICVVAVTSVAALVTLFSLDLTFLWLGAAVPVVVCQDVFRNQCFGLRTPSIAVASDALWLSAFLVACALSAPLGLTTQVILPAYVLAGMIALGVALVRPRSAGGPPGTCPTNLRAVVAEMTATTVVAQASTIAVAAVFPLAVVGVVRSAQLLMSGASIVTSVLTTFLVPRMSSHPVARSVPACGALVVVAAALSVVLLALLPTGLTTGVLGFTLTTTFFVSSAAVGLGLAVSASIGLLMVSLRDLHSARLWLPARVVASVVEPCLTIPLAFVIGAPALASNVLLSNAVFALDFRRRLRVESRRTELLSPRLKYPR